MSTYYDEYRNNYYNPDDVEEQPGDNQNWKMIQKGFDTLSAETKGLAFFSYSNSAAVTVESGKYYKIEATLDDTVYAALSALNDVSSVIMNANVFFIGSHGSDIIVHSIYTLRQASGVYVTRFNIANKSELQSGAKIGLQIENISDSDITFPAESIIVVFDFFRG